MNDISILESDDIKLGIIGSKFPSNIFFNVMTSYIDNIKGIFDNEMDESSTIISNLKPIRIYESEDDLLNDNEINIVFINNGQNTLSCAQSLIKAIKSGKHVLITGLVCETENEFLMVTEATELAIQKNLVIMTYHPHRYDIMGEVIQDLSKNMTGEPVYFQYIFYEPREENKRDQNITSTNLSLEHFINQKIDMINFIFGMEEVSGTIISHTENRYQVVGQRQDGLTFNLMGSQSLKQTNKIYEQVVINYERARLEIDYVERSVTVYNYEFDSHHKMRFPSEGKKSDEIKHLLINFFKCILQSDNNNHQPYISVKEILFNNIFPLILEKNNYLNNNNNIPSTSNNSIVNQDQPPEGVMFIRKKTMSQAYQEKPPFIIPSDDNIEDQSIEKSDS